MNSYKILLFIFLLSGSQLVFGQSAELKKKKAALTREIEALKKEQRKIAGNKRLSIKQIDALNAQISLREEKINTINSEINFLDNQIKEKTEVVHSLQGELNTLKKEYAAMIVFAQKNQNAYNKLMFVFAAESFNQAYKRLKYMQQFSERQRFQAYRIRGTQKVLGGKIHELDINKRTKSSLLQSEKAEKVELSEEKKDQAQQLDKLTKDEKKLKQQVDSRKKELTRLNKAISAAIAREIAAERKRIQQEAARAAAAKAARDKIARDKAEKARLADASKTGSTKKTTTAVAESKAEKAAAELSTPVNTANVKLSADFSGNHGRLPWPASGSIVARFGINKYGSVTVQNNGIDIRTGAGAPVSAVFAGEARAVLTDISGYTLLVKHGNYFSVYSNLRSVNVSKGQSISAGQSIGSVKTNPDDGTSQLHFEIWNGSKPTNPEGWLRR